MKVKYIPQCLRESSRSWANTRPLSLNSTWRPGLKLNYKLCESFGITAQNTFYDVCTYNHDSCTKCLSWMCTCSGALDSLNFSFKSETRCIISPPGWKESDTQLLRCLPWGGRFDSIWHVTHAGVLAVKSVQSVGAQKPDIVSLMYDVTLILQMTHHDPLFSESWEFQI